MEIILAQLVRPCLLGVGMVGDWDTLRVRESGGGEDEVDSQMQEGTWEDS